MASNGETASNIVVSENRLTRFPDLQSTITKDRSVRITQEFDLDLSRDDEATTIFLWGIFLNYYTGSEEPVFIFDSEIVAVQIRKWTFRRSKFQETLSLACDGTGISTEVRSKSNYLKLYDLT